MSWNAHYRERLLRGLREAEGALEDWQRAGPGPGLPDRDRLRQVLRRLHHLIDHSCRAAESAAVAGGEEWMNALVGPSPAMRTVRATIRRIAPRESHVLVQGESGTGKELIARAIHAAGPRHRGCFVAVDCGSVAESLLESELFGHRKGSFTGATLDRVGLLEEADDGTLFLDELANASPAFQTRLLRVLQEQEIRRVGENQVRRLSLRVIAATSGDLHRLMAAGRFREDLYYRLHVLSVEVPPLRDRRDDIPPLVRHALDESCRRHGLPLKRVNQAALEVLVRYHWPGNVRELKNVVERAVLMSSASVISPDSLPGPLLDALLHLAGPESGPEARKSGEQKLVERALLEANGDRTRAARLIGWPRSKLYRRLRRYGIPREFGRERR
jgi:DNA-binding NtrC family response regulator